MSGTVGSIEQSATDDSRGGIPAAEKRSKPNTPFTGDEIVPLPAILGDWKVAFDVIVSDDDAGLEVEERCLSVGCLISIDEDGVASIGKVDKPKEDDGNHLEGTLTPIETLLKKDDAAKRRLFFKWEPPKDKTTGKIGYSDFYEQGNENGLDMNVTMEHCTQWKGRFPLARYGFETRDSFDAIYNKLPSDGFIMVVHWGGFELGSFGYVKEFVYMVRPEVQAEMTEMVLSNTSAHVISF